MPPRMFSVEGMTGLRSWRYADGTANLRAVVAASSSIADGVASALKPRRTRISPYPAAATARAIRISKTAFQGFMSASLVPSRPSMGCLPRQARSMAAPKGAPVNPPSTTSSTALMYDESSEARKSTALAKSSGSPQRPSGIVEEKKSESFADSS
jgi:hypothetical protein